MRDGRFVEYAERGSVELEAYRDAYRRAVGQ